MQGARPRILYRRSNDQPLSISDANLLGSGGEGSIYALDQFPDLAAKVYHSPGGSIGAKLILMVSNPPTMAEREGHVSIAWPLDTLHSSLPATPGNTVGFLMHRISSMQPVNQCYNPAARKRSFPHFTYRHLCTVAINIAIAVNAVHERNYVIGDINESNIMIDDHGLVTLIDTDSFQVIDQSDGTIYRSPVGKPEYTPPELQGHSFDTVDRNQYHDRFGLGVIIFQLLMEGRHPYAGRYTGPGEPPAIEDNIARGYFLYRESRAVPLVEGPGYLPWQAIGGSVADLFMLCFDRGHDNQIVRPTAFQWEDAIGQAVGSFTTCARNSCHQYFGHNPACPWCDRRDMLRGRDPFPVTSGPEPLLMRTATAAGTPPPGGRAPPAPQPQPRPPRPSRAARPQPRPTAQQSSSFRGIPLPSNTSSTWAVLLLIVLGFSLLTWGVASLVAFLESDPFGSDGSPPTAIGGSPVPSSNLPPTSLPTIGPAVAALPPAETPTPTLTPEPSPTATPIPIVAVVDDTPTPYPIQPTYTPLPTSTPWPTSTPLPTNTPSPTVTPTSTPSPTVTPVPTATFTATPVPTATNTPIPTPTFTPMPTATPTLTPTPIPILPDLVIGSVSAPPQAPAIWEEAPFVVTVNNEGTASAREFSVGLYDGEEIIDEREIGGLTSSDTKEVTLVWRAEASPRPLSIIVDRDNRIAEADEGNNSLFAPLVTALAPNYRVGDVTWHPQKPEIYESVRFWVHVENTSGSDEVHDVGVAFYIDGEYHSWSRLEKVVSVDQISSDSWEAQKGSHEVAAVLYPTGYFDHSTKSSWKEFNHRYIVAIGRATYDHTRLPNLAVTDVEFSQENVAGTDTFYLDTRVTVLNKVGDDGLRPPPVTNSFDVRIEFKTSFSCPFRTTAPCEATFRIDGLDRGAGVTRIVEGTVPLPLPRSGGVHEFRVVVTVDPLNVVDESDESDNITEATSRVTNN